VFSIRPFLSGFQVLAGTGPALLRKNLPAGQRFNKNPFQIPEKPATILRKEHFIPTNPEAMATICKHPRVRIVSRHEDTEFVECLECGEVFDSEEFRDMELEEIVETEDARADS
jgi:hypothetical protein